MECNLLSKGAFAGHIGVSPGRVSQMIASGMIGPEALDGTGRNSKVKVAVAVAQIERRRDIGQAMGNGIGTRLDVPHPATEPSSSLFEGQGETEKSPHEGFADPKRDSVETEIKRQRLEKETRSNRRAAEQDALNAGRLMEVSDAKVEMNRVASAMMMMFEGALSEFASGLSARFELPQRDVLHELKQIYVVVRKDVSDKESRRAEDLPETTEVALEQQVKP